MNFNYYNKDNQIRQMNIQVGKEWNSYKKESSNHFINSILNYVDKNSDGKVDQEEISILQKLVKIIDSQIDKFKNNNIIENEELEFVINAIEAGELETLEGNKNESLRTANVINLPADKDKLTDYKYLTSFWDDNDNIKLTEVNVDYSAFDKLSEGKYFIETWKMSISEDGTVTYTPVIKKIQDSHQDGTTNWSEGINRNISKIQLSKQACTPALAEFMSKIGEEEGFIIELIDDNSTWVEDLSIVRSDKKQLIPNTDSELILKMCDNNRKITADRRHITLHEQGAPAQKQNSNENSPIVQYSHTVSSEDVIEGISYLEGGNVLNTLTKNGEPAAVIGNESLKYTMLAMELDDSEDSVQVAKTQIAKELGIKQENLTIIPQYDFHIDMHYRALNDGQMGIPDYETGITVLNELTQNIDKKLTSSNIQSEQKEILENKKQKYLKLLAKLKEMQVATAEISKAAEEELKKQGYEIVKIPCFTDIDNGKKGLLGSSVENPVNYMNGVCGTSTKTGNKFYITNTSGDADLDEYMKNYLKQNVGFDKVFFAPTKNYLSALGGIDCLTKEF